MFPIELFGVKSNPAKSARNLGVIFDKNFTFRSDLSAAAAALECFSPFKKSKCHINLLSFNVITKPPLVRNHVGTRTPVRWLAKEIIAYDEC